MVPEVSLGSEIDHRVPLGPSPSDGAENPVMEPWESLESRSTGTTDRDLPSSEPPPQSTIAQGMLGSPTTSASSKLE